MCSGSEARPGRSRMSSPWSASEPVDSAARENTQLTFPPFSQEKRAEVTGLSCVSPNVAHGHCSPAPRGTRSVKKGGPSPVPLPRLQSCCSGNQPELPRIPPWSVEPCLRLLRVSGKGGELHHSPLGKLPPTSGSLVRSSCKKHLRAARAQWAPPPRWPVCQGLSRGADPRTGKPRSS